MTTPTMAEQLVPDEVWDAIQPLLPAKLGCGSGVTCWRRLRDWQAAGVWEALHHRLLDWLGDDGQVDWSRAAIDSVSVRARRGGNWLARIRSTGASQAPSTTC